MLPPAMKNIAGIVSTGNDKTVLPLQAADLLAGQATRKLVGRNLEAPYQLLAREKSILFSPGHWGELILAQFAE